MERLLDASVASSTAKVYRQHEMEYLEFCDALGLSAVGRASKKAVQYWVASLSGRGLGHGTVLSRLSAIRHMFRRCGVPIEFESDRLQLILKGLKRSPQSAKGLKQPVTVSHLRRLCGAADHLGGGARGFRAMVAVAFFGFLRPSEFCESKAGHHLRWGDVKFAKDGGCVLELRSYKHSLEPAKISIGCVPARCPQPVVLLKDYCGSRSGVRKGDSLFDMSTREFGRLLGEMCEVAAIKTKITPHCFRHGGATWASRQGWSDSRIRTHGRWRSGAYISYIRA